MIDSILATQIFLAIDPEAFIEGNILCIYHRSCCKAFCQGYINQLLIRHF